MRRDTYIAQSVKMAENKRKSDLACKKILASREVLAYILKGVVPEYVDSSLEEIEKNYIEPDIIFQRSLVVPGLTGQKEYIEGMQQEDGIVGEATIFFDVKFKALLPGAQRRKAQLCLYFDIEAQNKYRPGYPLEKRGIYYLSRLISSQIQTVSEDTNYNVLQKTYSIWICLGNDIPKRERQSITRYAFQKQDIYGCSGDKKADYDLMSLIIIRLGEGPAEEKTLGMLQTLFLGEMSSGERLRKLKEDYQLKISRETAKEVEAVYTYTDMMEERIEKRVKKRVKEQVEKKSKGAGGEKSKETGGETSVEAIYGEGG